MSKWVFIGFFAFILVIAGIIAWFGIKKRKMPASLTRFIIVLFLIVFGLFLIYFFLGNPLFILVMFVPIIFYSIKSAINSSSMPPLVKAASKGDTEKCRKLVQKGNAVDKKTVFGDTALIFAVIKGSLETVNYLISKKASVNMHGMDGRTPLIAALQNYTGKHYEILKTLLENHAEIEARDKSQQTALMVAVEEENVEAVKLLIEKGADVNATIITNRNLGHYTNDQSARVQVKTSVLIDAPDEPSEIRKMLIDAGAKEIFESLGSVYGVRIESK